MSYEAEAWQFYREHGHARDEDPPYDPDREPEDDTPSPKPQPRTNLTQTVLATKDGLLREYPMSDIHLLKDEEFGYGGMCLPQIVYGYILNRRPKFCDHFYGWGIARN